MTQATTVETKPKPRRRIGLRLCLVFGAMILAGAVAVLSLIGVQVRVPDYFHDKITSRINNDISSFRMEFGEISVVLERNWIPYLRLRNVAIRRPDGAVLARLSDVESQLALKPMLNGQFQPASIRLSGAQIKVSRAKSGTVNLSLADTGETLQEAANFAELAAQLDSILNRPHFAKLDIVEAGNLTVRYEDARAGQAWTVDGGRMALTRDGEDVQIRGDFALLGGRDYAATLEMNYAGRLGELEAEFGVSFEDVSTHDIARQSPALAWLDALDAPISGALRASVGDDGNLAALNATLQIGAGVLRPTDATRPIAFDAARSYFTYDPDEQVMRFDELFLDSKWVRARAEGKAFLVGMEDGWPSEMLGQLSISDLSANPKSLYAEPVSLDAATVDMRLQMEPFAVSLGEISLSDQGKRLVLNGEIRAAEEGWDLAIDGRMDSLTPDRLMALWPVSVKEKTRSWIAENVISADLGNIQLALRAVPDHKPDVFLGFDFENLKTRFMKQMPPIIGASGHAALYEERFVINADMGHVIAPQGGRIDVSGTSFVVPSVNVQRGPARVHLSTDSTITAALALLDEEPFRFMQKAGQPVTLADGRAKVSGQLDFLLKDNLTPDEVAFDVTGLLSAVRSSVLVKDRVLTAGTLNFFASHEGLQVSGKAHVGQVPVSGKWEAPIGAGANGRSRISGQIELSERFVDEFRIGLPPGSISGAGSASIDIAFEKGRPGKFTLNSDLSGVGLRIQQLDWALSQQAKGNLEVQGQLGEPPSIDTISLDAAGLRAQGRVTLRASGLLNRAEFSRVQVGNWLNAPVVLVGRGADLTPEVQVPGGIVDLRQTSLNGSDGQGVSAVRRGGPVKLQLEKLQISEGISLTDFSADLDTTRGTDGSFTGRVNGGAVIRGRVVPQKGRSAFRIQSDDAGGVLSSAGLLKQARDGTLELILTPIAEPGSYDGRLQAKNLRLKDAPALASLLNALSVVGILEQLNGEGIHFGQVQARFRLTPDRVTLLSSSATGASMGITMDGYYHMKSGQMDMQGVVSPLYLVNAIGGVLTRRGEGLFGFNYSLKGPASSPRVQVNPLSALTPGMFREIFRRPPPSVQRDGDETTDPSLQSNDFERESQKPAEPSR